MRIANDGGFRDCRVFVDGGFNFGGAETVAGDVDDVIDAARAHRHPLAYPRGR